MAIRLGGRLLQGSDVRAVDTALRDKGLDRELRRAIQRGDSPNSMNRIFKQAGYRFNRFQTVNYLSQTVKPSVLLTYTDAISRRYGRGSLISAAAFEKAGYAGDIHVRISGIDKSGNYEEITIKFKGFSGESLSDLTRQIIEDLPLYTQNYPLDPDSIQIQDIYLT